MQLSESHRPESCRPPLCLPHPQNLPSVPNALPPLPFTLLGDHLPCQKSLRHHRIRLGSQLPIILHLGLSQSPQAPSPERSRWWSHRPRNSTFSTTTTTTPTLPLPLPHPNPKNKWGNPDPRVASAQSRFSGRHANDAREVSGTVRSRKWVPRVWAAKPESMGATVGGGWIWRR